MEVPHHDNEKMGSLNEKDAGNLKQNHDDAEIEVFIDPAKEVKLLAKLDLAFTPVIMLVYLSCFLDRSNIGIHPLITTISS
jgi:hypothetical protein